MSADKRSTHTDALATLGTIIQDGGRDAIHLAVEPITAGEDLKPGQDIGIINGIAFSSVDKHLGIVDPFLKDIVSKGQKFWLIVYPRQITSLRHVWSHPDFPEEHHVQTDLKQDSVKWMTEWAKEHMSYDYYGEGVNDRLSDAQAFNNAIEAGRDNHLGPYEGAGDYIDNTWWYHWEAITGLQGNRDQYFSCGC